MKLLLDTNVLIPAEPTSPENIEPGTPTVLELLRLTSEGSHQAYVHPASTVELNNDKDPARRRLRAILVQRYPKLPSPPPMPSVLKSKLGSQNLGSHDYVDDLLLAAVHSDAVDYLVTEDLGIIRKARRTNLSSRVLTPAAAIDALNGLSRRLSIPPPSVRQVYAYELDSADPIFETFKTDYLRFEDWLSKCKREHRLAWVVEDESGHLAGVCIVKEENSGEHGLQGNLLKLCSFKIADEARGSRFGELLLKAVFNYAFENRYDHAYVEVLPKYKELINLTETFGFCALLKRTDKNELVTVKKLKFSKLEYESLDALDFHVHFGPKYVKVTDAFVVPIKPKYHDLLFPELAPQASLFTRTNAYGNGILKAYLCLSPTRQIRPGSTLLFYESERDSQVRCVGVIEETLVSSSSEEIARFVGQRTVYSLEEIEGEFNW